MAETRGLNIVGVSRALRFGLSREGASAMLECGSAGLGAVGCGNDVSGARECTTIMSARNRRRRRRYLNLCILIGALVFITCAHGTHADDRSDVLKAARAAAAQQDYATERELLRPLADAGDSDAQTMLGDLYKNGKGVPQDYAKAFGWYQKAANGGDVQAETDLGTAYFDGAGDPRNYQDYAAAARWWRRAARGGSAEAEANLGVAYKLGQGVPENDHDAARWFRKSAAQGNAVAQYNLGIMSEYGEAGAVDRIQSAVWFTLSADGGDKEAAELRDALEKSMSHAQIEEVGRRVAEWRPGRAGAQ
jgi:predicted nucleic acid-binding Zn ribbon protein